jgi:hypothetical protein
MRNGGSAHKGAQFERAVAQALSMWISGGQSKDIFWRSAGSGARATRGRAKGLALANQAGDISAVSAQGALLTERFFFECKHRAKIDAWQFVQGRRSVLGGLWAKAQFQATEHSRTPTLIVKQNLGPILTLLPWPIARDWNCCRPSLLAHVVPAGVAILSFSELVRQPFEPPPSL